jgi:hypothetical protein
MGGIMYSLHLSHELKFRRGEGTRQRYESLNNYLSVSAKEKLSKVRSLKFEVSESEEKAFAESENISAAVDELCSEDFNKAYELIAEAMLDYSDEYFKTNVNPKGENPQYPLMIRQVVCSLVYLKCALLYNIAPHIKPENYGVKKKVLSGINGCLEAKQSATSTVKNHCIHRELFSETKWGIDPYKDFEEQKLFVHGAGFEYAGIKKDELGFMLAELVKQHFDVYKHRVYGGLFAGSGTALLCIPPFEGVTEYLNDYSTCAFEFHRVVRNSKDTKKLVSFAKEVVRRIKVHPNDDTYKEGMLKLEERIAKAKKEQKKSLETYIKQHDNKELIYTLGLWVYYKNISDKYKNQDDEINIEAAFAFFFYTVFCLTT